MAYLAVKPALEPELCIDVSAEQAALMLRAIGGDSTPYRKYRDSKYYYASQNHADKGADDALWEDLVEKGAALKYDDSYAVSTRGLWYLECYTDSTIYAYYPDPGLLIIGVLTLHELYDHCSEFPMSIRALARNLYLNERQVAGIIHRYASEGYVEKYCYRGAHGWRITDKVKSHPEYQKQYAEVSAMRSHIKEKTKACMRKDLPHVSSAFELGACIEFIYGDMPGPHGGYFPEDIRGLGFTDEKIRELFPDMDDLIPGNWSSHGYTHGKFELGLYLEPEGSRLPDWYGPYTLQMFFADDDIVCISAR